MFLLIFVRKNLDWAFQEDVKLVAKVSLVKHKLALVNKLVLKFTADLCQVESAYFPLLEELVLLDVGNNLVNILFKTGIGVLL